MTEEGICTSVELSYDIVPPPSLLFGYIVLDSEFIEVLTVRGQLNRIKKLLHCHGNISASLKPGSGLGSHY